MAKGVQKGQTCLKVAKLAEIGQKWLKMARSSQKQQKSGQKWAKVVKSSPKQQKKAQSRQNWPSTQKRQKQSKVGKSGQKQSKPARRRPRVNKGDKKQSEAECGQSRQKKMAKSTHKSIKEVENDGQINQKVSKSGEKQSKMHGTEM